MRNLPDNPSLLAHTEPTGPVIDDRFPAVVEDERIVRVKADMLLPLLL
jgi:hypothetical protein